MSGELEEVKLKDFSAPNVTTYLIYRQDYDVTRFLENKLRETWEFHGTPILLFPPECHRILPFPFQESNRENQNGYHSHILNAG